MAVFVSRFEEQGFQAVADLLELDISELSECAREAGMRKGHDARLRRWFKQLQPRGNPSVSPELSIDEGSSLRVLGAEANGVCSVCVC